MFRSIYTICVNYEAKIEAGAETGLKIRLQQNTRLRAAPVPKPWFDKANLVERENI